MKDVSSTSLITSPALYQTYSTAKTFLQFRSDEAFLTFLLDAARPVISFVKYRKSSLSAADHVTDHVSDHVSDHVTAHVSTSASNGNVEQLGRDGIDTTKTNGTCEETIGTCEETNGTCEETIENCGESRYPVSSEEARDITTTTRDVTMTTRDLALATPTEVDDPEKRTEPLSPEPAVENGTTSSESARLRLELHQPKATPELHQPKATPELHQPTTHRTVATQASHAAATLGTRAISRYRDLYTSPGKRTVEDAAVEQPPKRAKLVERARVIEVVVKTESDSSSAGESRYFPVDLSCGRCNVADYRTVELNQSTPSVRTNNGSVVRNKSTKTASKQDISTEDGQANKENPPRVKVNKNCKTGKALPSKQVLNQNRATNSVSPLICSVCGAVYKHKHLFHRHLNSHKRKRGKYLTVAKVKETSLEFNQSKHQPSSYHTVPRETESVPIRNPDKGEPCPHLHCTRVFKAWSGHLVRHVKEKHPEFLKTGPERSNDKLFSRLSLIANANESLLNSVAKKAAKNNDPVAKKDAKNNDPVAKKDAKNKDTAAVIIFGCSFCDRKFRKENVLDRHISYHIRKGDKPSTGTATDKPKRGPAIDKTSGTCKPTAGPVRKRGRPFSKPERCPITEGKATNHPALEPKVTDSSNEFNCPCCTSPFSAQDVLWEHLRTSCPGTTTPPSCCFCAQNVKNPEKFLSHIKKKHCKLQCNLCDAIVPRSELMTHHMTRHDTNWDNKKTGCFMDVWHRYTYTDVLDGGLSFKRVENTSTDAAAADSVTDAAAAVATDDAATAAADDAATNANFNLSCVHCAETFVGSSQAGYSLIKHLKDCHGNSSTTQESKNVYREIYKVRLIENGLTNKQWRENNKRIREKTDKCGVPITPVAVSRKKTTRQSSALVKQNVSLPSTSSSEEPETFSCLYCDKSSYKQALNVIVHMKSSHADEYQKNFDDARQTEFIRKLYKSVYRQRKEAKKNGPAKTTNVKKVSDGVLSKEDSVTE